MTIGYQRIRTRSLLTVWLGEPRLDDDRVDRPTPATVDVLAPLVQDFVILFTESILMLMGCCLRQSCLPGIPIKAWRCRSRPSERNRVQMPDQLPLPAAQLKPFAGRAGDRVLGDPHAVSMKLIVKSALDAFSAAAGTGVNTRGGHSDRRTAAHRARRDIRSSRAVTRRTSATPSLDRPAGSEPDAGQRGVEHLLGRDERVQVLGRAVLAIHRRACTRSTSSSGMSQANCASRTPGLLCYGPNRERRCPRDGETDRSRGQNCAVR